MSTENTVFIKKYFNQIIIVVSIILLFLLWTLLKDWLRPNVIKWLGGYTAMEYKESIATISIKRDTIYFDKVKIKTEIKEIVKPVVVTKYVSNLSSLPITGKQSPTIPIDSVFIYSQPISDTLIDGNIRTVVSLENCKIIEQSLDYKPKFPILVKEYVTIEKTKEQVLFNKPKAKIGLGVTTFNFNTIGAVGVYQTPKNVQYQVGYLRSLDNVFVKDQKGFITVSIIKLF